MLKNFKYNIQNVLGWRSNRKIVVIESDDWGSIRMPSKKIFNKLEKAGYRPEQDPYLKYDSLASEDDLNALFEVLTSVRDKNRNNAIITANTVVANPDFSKIQNNNFEKYFYEPFTSTLKKYPEHNNSFNLWKEGMNDNIFHPQFHGREHLNVHNWLYDLQNGNKHLQSAFENKMISISSMPSKMRFGYMESLDFFSVKEMHSKAKILESGLDLFRSIFNFHSKSFIANCYIWNFENEKVLAKNKVEYIQSNPFQFIPQNRGNSHNFKRKYHFTGQCNQFGQQYLVRNVYFEPSNSKDLGNISSILKRIEVAFKWKKPVIICSHRLNFIGSINETNRKENLLKMKSLLYSIVKKWPDVEFMTSDKLGDLMSKNKNE